MRCAALLLFVCACTTTRELKKPLNAPDIRQLNGDMADREVEVGFYAEAGDIVDVATVDATQVHLAPDKLRFAVEGAQREVPVMALQQLSFLSPGSPRLRGALDGLFFGGPIALAGIGVGLSAQLTCGAKESCSAETVAPIVVGAALGLVLAPIVGALIGHHDEVSFR